MNKEKETMRDRMSDVIEEIMILESEPDCIYTRRFVDAKNCLPAVSKQAFMGSWSSQVEDTSLEN